MRLDGPIVRGVACLLILLTGAPTPGLAAKGDARAGGAAVEAPAGEVKGPSPELQRLSNDILKAWGVSGAGLGLALIGGGTLMRLRLPLAAIGVVALGVAVGVVGFFKQREATAAYQAARKAAFTRGEL